jgi:indole-3-glycerol phosphate synthase
VIGPRRLSQAISEGEGISILVEVADRADAAAAETDGASGIALGRETIGVRDATALPLLWTGASFREAHGVGADAVVLAVEDGEGSRLEELFEEAHELGLECVLRVRDEGELELALARLDPEVLLLTAQEGEDGRVERVLELLPDVPAGKLAIAQLRGASDAEIDELERAGIDAVLVARA